MADAPTTDRIKPASNRAGKAVITAMFLFALGFGAVLYYVQVYAYYEEVDPDSAAAVMRLTSTETGKPEEIAMSDFQGVDAPTSPIRFRGCFRTSISAQDLASTYQPYGAAHPLNGPPWFTCFDAQALEAAIEDGTAQAFLSEAEFADGVDRLMIIYPDGRAYVWQQLNEKYAN